MNQATVLDNENDDITQEILRLRGFPANTNKRLSSDPKGTGPDISKALDLSDAKLVPSLIIVRTTFFYQNDRLEKRTDEVIARFYTTKIRPKLIDRVSSQMESARQAGFDGAYEILSKKGRPLASVKKTTAQGHSNLLIIDPKTNPRHAVDIIASYPKGANQIMIQNPEQLKTILPIARRMGIDKIYTTEKTLQDSKLKAAHNEAKDLLGIMPNIEIRSVRSKIKMPETIPAHKRDTVINTTLGTSTEKRDPIWQDLKLPHREALKTVVPNPKIVIDNEISHEQAHNQILLERIINSIVADVTAAEESGRAPRESLLNLNRSSEHIRNNLGINTHQIPLSETRSSITIRDSEAMPTLSEHSAAKITGKKYNNRDLDNTLGNDVINSSPKPSLTSATLISREVISRESREIKAQSAIDRLRASRKNSATLQLRAKSLAA